MSANPFIQWKKNETRWIDRDWNSEEKAIFEDAIQQHGAELRLIREEIGTRSVYEVARYYGHWKRYVITSPNHRNRWITTGSTAQNSRKSMPRSGKSVPRTRRRKLHPHPLPIAIPKVLS